MVRRWIGKAEMFQRGTMALGQGRRRTRSCKENGRTTMVVRKETAFQARSYLMDTPREAATPRCWLHEMGVSRMMG